MVENNTNSYTTCLGGGVMVENNTNTTCWGVGDGWKQQ